MCEEQAWPCLLALSAEGPADAEVPEAGSAKGAGQAVSEPGVSSARAELCAA